MTTLEQTCSNHLLRVVDEVMSMIGVQGSKHLAGHMTPEAVERHLESRRAQQSQLEFTFAPDKAPATVPTEMFSNDVEGAHSFLSSVPK